MAKILEKPLPASGRLARAAPALLEHAITHEAPPTERRIFVNRALRIETIRFVGFDLDWTLADYDRLPLERLTFELAVERLIDHHAYPPDIRRAEFRPDFPLRGLLIDKEAGTVLRMSRHRYVGRAYLGRRRLGSEERGRLYRHEPINPASDRFYHVDTLFELPEANLFAELVELRGDIELPAASHARLFEDVRAAIDWVHAEGPLKRQIVADPTRFLQRDPELGVALARLALGGRRLVLLTNSEWSYASAICSFLFDGLLPGVGSWRQLFDLVVIEARKPAFFRGYRPFAAVREDGSLGPETEVPEWGGVYRGGCLSGLMRLLDCPGEQVLYVGDHIYGDIVSSKLGSTWRTALVVRELEEELKKRTELRSELRRLGRLKHRMAELGYRMDHLQDVLSLRQGLAEKDLEAAAADPQKIRRALTDLSRRHRRVRRRVSQLAERIDSHFNPTWGSLFKQESSKTLFASQLETFACLYTSRVSNFAFYGSNHYFRVLEDPMMHEVVKDRA